MTPGQHVPFHARRYHVKELARQRFGLEVNRHLRQTLIRRVTNGDVKYARKVTNSRTVVVLDYDGREMTFLYSSATKDIVTFLSPDAPETAEWRRSQPAAALPLCRPRQCVRDWRRV
jgi:hypothetical protein